MNSRWVLIITGAFLLTINTGCEKGVQDSDILVYGHAGTTLFPERWVYPANTAESVIYALDALNADGVEVDVQMTRDSVLVLYHDGYLQPHTRMSGCISDYLFGELNNVNLYHTKYELATLSEVVALCLDRNKKLFLDLKPYNYCDSTEADYGQLNRALNMILAPYSHEQKQQVVVNTRNPVLLSTLSDTSIIKSFETENWLSAIEKFQLNEMDELCINATALDLDAVSSLNAAGLKFTIFGVKSTGEIADAVRLSPQRIITDNIAYTRKITQ